MNMMLIRNLLSFQEEPCKFWKLDDKTIEVVMKRYPDLNRPSSPNPVIKVEECQFKCKAKWRAGYKCHSSETEQRRTDTERHIRRHLDKANKKIYGTAAHANLSMVTKDGEVVVLY